MPTTTTTYPFPIDGKRLPVFLGKLHDHWRSAASDHGFTLLGRAVDRLHVVLACRHCGAPTLKRINVVLGHNPECPHCIKKRRTEAAGKVGAQLIGADPDGDRHYGLYRFACGHSSRRQHTRVEAAAAGSHSLSCEACTSAHHAAEAEAQDWHLIGPSARKNPSYRRYEHACGHHQDVAIANMRRGDVDCAGCGETWSSKPSQIYILEFELPDLPVIKLGFSSNPAFRMRQVQHDPEVTRGSVRRAIDMITGHRAICVEKALHAHIKSHRPDLIVPPEFFRKHIRTTSEVYHRHGRSYVEALLDAVDAGWDPAWEV